jgi:hypothetical protein
LVLALVLAIVLAATADLTEIIKPPLMLALMQATTAKRSCSLGIEADRSRIARTGLLAGQL